ncbi:MAG: hypothetical protein ABFS42_01930 [Candidatus Krumholzibacteriota bacterium]
MKKIALLLTVLALVLPSFAYPENSLDFELEIDLVLGSEADQNEYFFGNVTPVVEDSQGNIYIGDIKQECIFKFKPNGEFVGQWGRPGEGPGDLMPYFVIAMDSQDRIYATGQGGRVQILDTEGKHVGSFDRANPASSARSIAVLPDGGIAITANNLTNHTTVDLYDPSRRHIKSFSDTYAVGLDIPSRVESVYAGGHLAVTSNGALLYLQMAPLLVRKYDQAGDLLLTTTEGGEGFVEVPPMPEVDGDRTTFRFLSGTTGIVPLPNGGAVATSFRRDDDMDTHTLMCIYDENLELVGRKEMVGGYFVVGSSGDGGVYLFRRLDEGNTVERGKVEFRASGTEGTR